MTTTIFRTICLAATISFLATCAFAQSTFQLKGKILDLNSASGLPGAGCVVLNPGDSVPVKSTQSNPDGTFQIIGLPNGIYLLKVQYLGYKTRLKKFTINNQDAEIGSLGMEESAVDLKAVKIEGRIPPVRQMGDTAQFNASGYKTNSDATTEDLITKMPGVTVTDGKVSIQGEEVRKVLIDNKPFFGDDPNTALKNLPADVVDKVQVFDQMSEQSRFTGFNDGNTTKTINIITKAGMRNGNFGKAFVGGGTDERFKSGLTLNRFQGPRRLTLIGQANNINEQNFSMSDLAGMMGSGGGGGGRGGMGGGGGGMGGGRNGGFNQAGQDFFVNSKKGIVNTKALGFNYSDNWGKKVEVSANYFFNQSRNDVKQRTIRNYVVSRDSGQAYTDSSNRLTDNLNHRFNIRLDAKLDSNNSILYTPRFTYQDVQSTNNTLGANELLERPVNSTNNDNILKQKTFNLNNEVLFRHKFKKKGRTVSITSNLGNNGSWGNSTQNSANRFFGKIETADTLRQRSDLNRTGWSIQNNVTYTEPISDKSQLSLTYAYNYAYTENERLTYRTEGKDSLDRNLSNKFVSETPSQYAGIGYAYNNAKSNLNVNVNLQQSQLRNDRTFPVDYTLTRTFQNILPTFVWRYSITDKKNFRLVYRTSANAPSIEQLQDVVNNSNPLQLSTGNSGLRQDYQHNMFFRYMGTNAKNNSSFFAMIGGSATRHYIGTSTLIARRDTVAEGVILNRGSQLTKPVNLDGYYSLRSFLMYTLPVTKLKTNLNVNANANFTRTPGKVNGQINYANSPTLGAGLSLTSNISKAVDFNVSYNASYTSVENTLNKTQNNSYVNQIIGAKLNLVFFESVVFNTDYSQTMFTGLSQGFNTNFALLNLGVGYKFLKNKSGELRATVFDLLKQNTNISRTITETYTEDVRSNNLQRYFMLTFTYTLRAFKAPEGQSDRPNFPGMMRPGVGPPPGVHPGGM